VANFAVVGRGPAVEYDHAIISMRYIHMCALLRLQMRPQFLGVAVELRKIPGGWGCRTVDAEATRARLEVGFIGSDPKVDVDCRRIAMDVDASELAVVFVRPKLRRMLA
jgi:hypothetical protein